MRYEKYYEIFHKHLFSNKFIIWNTWPYKYDTPMESILWYEIKEKKTGFTRLIKNGPRFWMIDKAISYEKKSDKIKKINSMKFLKRAFINVKDIKENCNSGKLKLWTPLRIVRNTSWIYYRHAPIYYIKDDKDDTWILQSIDRYTKDSKYYKTPDKYYKQLEMAGYTLPQKWSYHVMILPYSVSINTGHDGAYILRDCFGNTFMKGDI